MFDFSVSRKNLPGFTTLSPVTKRKVVRTVIAFVDDADFFVNGEEIPVRAQTLIQKYNELYSASGGKGLMTKNNYFYWHTFFDRHGNIRYEDIDCTIYVDNTEIQKLSIDTPIKSLGVTSTPNNNWEPQFQVMKEKMETAVKKLKATILHPTEVRIYFHAYLIKSVFFGAEIVRLSEAQQEVLCKIYEAPLLQ